MYITAFLCLKVADCWQLKEYACWLASIVHAIMMTRTFVVFCACVCQGLMDPHAKVRWAACQAVGQLCTDLGPDLQEAEHARIVPGTPTHG